MTQEDPFRLILGITNVLSFTCVQFDKRLNCYVASKRKKVYLVLNAVFYILTNAIHLWYSYETFNQSMLSYGKSLRVAWIVIAELCFGLNIKMIYDQWIESKHFQKLINAMQLIGGEVAPHERNNNHSKLL